MGGVGAHARRLGRGAAWGYCEKNTSIRVMFFSCGPYCSGTVVAGGAPSPHSRLLVVHFPA